MHVASESDSSKNTFKIAMSPVIVYLQMNIERFHHICDWCVNRIQNLRIIFAQIHREITVSHAIKVSNIFDATNHRNDTRIPKRQ